MPPHMWTWNSEWDHEHVGFKKIDLLWKGKEKEVNLYQVVVSWQSYKPHHKIIHYLPYPLIKIVYHNLEKQMQI